MLAIGLTAPYEEMDMADAMSPTARRIGLAILIALFALFDYAAPQILYSYKFGESSPRWPAALFGAFLGQLTLITSYDVAGAERARDRMWKAGLLALLAWYSLTAGIVATGDSFEIGSLEQLLAVVATASCLVLAGGHWLMKLCGRNAWYVAGEPVDVEHPRRRQFSVRDILLWTTVAAAVCGVATTGVGRELWQKGWNVALPGAATLALGVGTVAALSLCVSLPALWCVLDGEVSERRRFTWIARIAGIVACEMAVGMVLFDLSRTQSQEVLLASFTANLGVLAGVVVPSLALRTLGYRVRWRIPPDARVL